MIKLSTTWHIPDTELPHDLDRHYFQAYLPAVRKVPGLRRHVVLKSILLPPTQRADEAHPRIWRGDDLWFDTIDTLRLATTSSAWREVDDLGYFASVAGRQTDLFEVLDEYSSAPQWSPGQVADRTCTLLRATWNIPGGQAPEPIDRQLENVHVPNVRQLPLMHRHAMLRCLPWPSSQYPRWWRGGDCWYEATKDFEADRPAHATVANDGFVAMVAGANYTHFLVEQEWLPRR